MLRINQLAKELGVSNHEVINTIERHLGIQGKSHSSNLSDGQVNSLRLIMKNKNDSKETVTKSIHQSVDVPNALVKSNVRIVKPPMHPSLLVTPTVKAAVLIKKSDGLSSSGSALAEADSSSGANESSVECVVEQSMQPAESKLPTSVRPALQCEDFSRLRISSTPVAVQKPKEPARYIQLPKQVPPKVRSESGSRPSHCSGQHQQQQSKVQRSGLPQAGRTLLPMAANTGKESVTVKYEPSVITHPQPQTPVQPTRRPFIPPSITELRSDSGFTRIKMSDTPAPAPRNLEPARYIQLPQARRPAPSRDRKSVV